jgi:hypothetical protein
LFLFFFFQGENDGGKYVQNKKLRQQLFLNFLQVDCKNSERYNRNGVYSSHRYIQQNGDTKDGVIDVIFLDTRSHRDNHWFPSLGGSNVPMGAVIGKKNVQS